MIFIYSSQKNKSSDVNKTYYIDIGNVQKLKLLLTESNNQFLKYEYER